MVDFIWDVGYSTTEQDSELLNGDVYLITYLP